jgi:hypothetical protein
MLRIALTVVAALAVVGCATQKSGMDAVNAMIGADKPLEYREGWRAGCSTGSFSAGHPANKFVKDLDRYSAQGLYREGWNDGKDTCFAAQNSRNQHRNAMYAIW